MNKFFQTFALLLGLALIARADETVIPSTAFTRGFMRQPTQAGALNVLGINTTNATIIIPPDNRTTDTNALGQLEVNSNGVTLAFTNAGQIRYVSTNGNNATAVAGRIDRPWRTIYDVVNGSTPVYAGAIVGANSQDTIWILPGYHTAPHIPLQRPGNGTLPGLNLVVDYGAVVSHTNYGNTNATGTVNGLTSYTNNRTSDLLIDGPFITMGHSSKVIIRGEIWATNNYSSSGDAVIGTSATLPQKPISAPRFQFGFTNMVPTNWVIVCEGSGFIWGWSDSVYFSGYGLGNLDPTNHGSGYILDALVRANWDTGTFFAGTWDVTTRHCYFWATNDNPNTAGSGGCAMANGTTTRWTDYNSIFRSTPNPDFNSGFRRAVISSAGSTNMFFGTVVISDGTNDFYQPSDIAGQAASITYGAITTIDTNGNSEVITFNAPTQPANTNSLINAKQAAAMIAAKAPVIFTPVRTYYIDNNGSSANSGTTPDKPLDSIATLQTKSYFGTDRSNIVALKFNGFFYVPQNTPLVLSNNALSISPGSIISDTYTNWDTTTLGFTNKCTVLINGPAQIVGGTIMEQATNNGAACIGISDQAAGDISIEVAELKAINTAITLSSGNVWTNIINLNVIGNVIDTLAAGISFGTGARNAATNSTIKIAGNSLWIHPQVPPAAPATIAAIAMPGTATGISMDGGHVAIVGNFIELAGSSMKGISLVSDASTYTKFDIADTPVSYYTNATPGIALDLPTTATPYVPNVYGHPYPENQITLSQSRFVNYLGDATNKVTSSLTGGFMTIDSVGIRTWTTNLFVSGLVVFTNAPRFMVTNAAPSNVTIGTTVADGFFTWTNKDGTQLFTPGWINH